MATVTPADLATQITEYVASVAVRDGLFYSWMTGAADGGVNHDGVFPLTDLSGFTRYLESPAKIMAQATTGFAQRFATKADLEAATASSYIPGTMVLVYADADNTKNGPYVRVAGGGWQYAQWFYDSLAQVIQSSVNNGLANVQTSVTNGIATIQASLASQLSQAAASANSAQTAQALSETAKAQSEAARDIAINATALKVNIGDPVSKLSETDVSKILTGGERTRLGLLQKQSVSQSKSFLPLTNWIGPLTRSPLLVDASFNELLGLDVAPADGGSVYRGHLINFLKAPFFAVQSFKNGARDLYTISRWSGSATKAPFWADKSGNELLGADIAPSNGWSFYRGHFLSWLFSGSIAKRLVSAALPALSTVAIWSGSTTKSPFWTDRSGNLLLGANNAPSDGVSVFEGYFVDYMLSKSGSGTSYVSSPVMLSVADKVPVPTSGSWLGLPVYGQSLSVGAQGQPVLTVSQNYANITFTGGVKSSSTSDKAATRALYEEALGENNATGTNRGETVSSTMANFTTKRYIANNGFAPTDCVIFAFNPGQGGTAIAGLSKGSSPYNRLLAQVQSAYNLAVAAGKTFVVSAVPWIQGETDADNGTTYAAYLAAVKQLVVDLNADIKAITGQTSSIHLFLCQTAYKSATQSQIALAQLQAVREHSLIHLITNYGFLPYNGDKTHSTNVGYIWLGHYLARAFYQLTALAQKPDCIMPISATYNGSSARVKFRTPTKLKLPSTATQTGWGFKASDDTGTLTVTAATISNTGDEVILTFNRAVGANLQIRYSLDYLAANNISGGAAGDLTDSTSDIASINGSTYSLVHRAPAFQLSAYFVET